MILEHINFRMRANCLDKALLNFETGIVGMVQNTELAVAALTVQVKVAVLFFIKVHTPLYQLAYLLRSALHYFFYGGGVAKPVACHHSIVDMLVEIVDFKIGH